MSSEAITRNDLTAILNEVLPPTPSEYKKLLWTNPSPTSAFSAQTISIDLSEYDAIEVVAQHWSNNGTTASMVAKVGEIGITTVPNYDNSTIATRSFVVSSSGVQFTDGRGVTGSSISTSSHASIPRRIYGIKYERVAPPQVDASDYVIEIGTNDIWSYRKWNSGKIEAFASKNWGGVSGSVWVSPIYYKDLTLSIPSGIFPSTPTRVFATGNQQWTVWGAWATSATQISLRCTTLATGTQNMTVDFYIIYEP